MSDKTIKPDCLDCENAVCDECDPDKPYAAVVCQGHGIPAIPACGKVDLTRAEYDEQMRYPDRGWRCPKCKADAWFDDERFEQLQGISVAKPPDESVIVRWPEPKAGDQVLLLGHAFVLVAPALVEACNRVAPWLSAALGDPKVCAEMKADAEAFLAALHPGDTAENSKP